MKRLIVRRERKFVSSLVPFFIVTDMTKKFFMEKYGLKGDFCKISLSGQPVPRMNPELFRYFPYIENGGFLSLDLCDDSDTCFAFTCEGNLSNEIKLTSGIYSELDDFMIFECKLSVKGGFLRTSYPWFFE